MIFVRVKLYIALVVTVLFWPVNFGTIRKVWKVNAWFQSTRFLFLRSREILQMRLVISHKVNCASLGHGSLTVD